MEARADEGADRRDAIERCSGAQVGSCSRAQGSGAFAVLPVVPCGTRGEGGTVGLEGAQRRLVAGQRRERDDADRGSLSFRYGRSASRPTSFTSSGPIG